jgi:hypothetical protein
MGGQKPSKMTMLSLRRFLGSDLLASEKSGLRLATVGQMFPRDGATDCVQENDIAGDGADVGSLDEVFGNGLLQSASSAPRSAKRQRESSGSTEFHKREHRFFLNNVSERGLLLSLDKRYSCTDSCTLAVDEGALAVYGTELGGHIA